MEHQSRPAHAGRLPLIDAIKVVASQLVVLHHLAFYGPLSDSAQSLAPALIGWLSQHGRLAVQAFLVVGGFLAARHLAPTSVPQVARPLSQIGQRYLRLAGPFVFALAIANIGAAVARAWMAHDSIPALPTPPQTIAHLFLLHDILDYDAMTAGAWYVAIDFQLFALTVAILWLAQRCGPRIAGGAMAIAFVALVASSWLVFNRNPDWDDWALYFFGAYGLGALAYWASTRTAAFAWLSLLALAGGLAALANGRPHAIVALGTALALGIGQSRGWSWRWPRRAPVGYLGRISYALFLVHFPVCLVVNALFQRLAPGDAQVAAVGMLAAWGASLLAGAAFHHGIEQPLAAFLSPPEPRRAASARDRRAPPAPHRA